MFACIFARHSSSKPLLDAAGAFSPRVEDTAPGTVVFDADGLERLFGTPEELAAKVLEHLRGAGIEANVAVAANPDAAIAAARGFAGATVLQQGEERRRLKELPLEILSPSPDMLETLARWGITTLGALAQLPVVQIAERLGQEGVRLHALARGAKARDLAPRRETTRFAERMELEDAASSIEALTFVVTELVDRLCRRLTESSLATHELRLTLGLERERILAAETARNRSLSRGRGLGEGIRIGAISPAAYLRVTRLPLPIRNPKILTKLLIMDLEAHPPGAAIVAIELEAMPVRLRALQTGLFAPQTPEPEQLELTMARIAAVVGQTRIGSPEPLDSHRPDAFRMQKFDPAFQVPSSMTPTVSPLSLRHFRTILEATVKLKSGEPCWLACPNGHGPIAAASGPWRASGEWWDSRRAWDREDWDIEALDALYRIHRDVASGRWFVDGTYD